MNDNVQLKVHHPRGAAAMLKILCATWAQSFQAPLYRRRKMYLTFPALVRCFCGARRLSWRRYLSWVTFSLNY
jgi:hypothetical protein